MNLDTDHHIFKLISEYLTLRESAALSMISKRAREFWKRFGVGDLYEIDNWGPCTKLSFKERATGPRAGQHKLTYFAMNPNYLNIFSDPDKMEEAMDQLVKSIQSLK
jgi:hypothetical protein